MATPLVWRNLSHRKGRLALSLAGIAFAVLIMTMERGFLHGFNDTATRAVASFDADLVMVTTIKDPQPRKGFSRARLTRALAYEGVAETIAVYVADAHWKSQTSGLTHSIHVYAFDPVAHAFRLPAADAHALELPDTVLFDARARDYYGQPRPGSHAEVNGRTIAVAGLYPLGTDFWVDGNLITSERTFRTLFPPRDGRPLDLTYGLIRLRAGADAHALCAALQRDLPADVRVLTRADYCAWIADFYTDNGIGFLFYLPSFVGLVIGVICCYQILYADIAEKQMQYATLKAIGYQGRYFIQAVLYQALLLALLGFVLGLAAAMVLFAYLEAATDVVLFINGPRALTQLIATVVMCEVAGLAALRKMLRADPADCF
jgi:putative ABC transport system permease protein